MPQADKNTLTDQILEIISKPGHLAELLKKYRSIGQFENFMGALCTPNGVDIAKELNIGGPLLQLVTPPDRETMPKLVLWEKGSCFDGMHGANIARVLNWHRGHLTEHLSHQSCIKPAETLSTLSKAFNGFMLATALNKIPVELLHDKFLLSANDIAKSTRETNTNVAGLVSQLFDFIDLDNNKADFLRELEASPKLQTWTNEQRHLAYKIFSNDKLNVWANGNRFRLTFKTPEKAQYVAKFLLRIIPEQLDASKTTIVVATRNVEFTPIPAKALDRYMRDLVQKRSSEPEL